MVKNCCVYTCSSESFGGCNISFHGFPKNKEMQQKWLSNIHVKQKVTKNSVVCSYHFEPSCFYSANSRQLLKTNAIPTIPPMNFESRTEIPDLQSQDEEESKMNERITVKAEINEPEDCPSELEEELRENKRELYLTIKPFEESSPKIARIEQVRSLVNEPKTSPNLMRIQEERTNEFDIFGKYVAAQLKSLNEEDAILAQDEVQSILTRYKLKKIRQKNDNYMRSSNSYTPRSYTSDSDPNDRFEN